MENQAVAQKAGYKSDHQDDQWLHRPIQGGDAIRTTGYSGGTVTDLHRVPFIELSLCSVVSPDCFQKHQVDGNLPQVPF
jgi:hypothetical protein